METKAQELLRRQVERSEYSDLKSVQHEMEVERKEKNCLRKQD